METCAPPLLTEAIAALWRFKPPGPKNLFSEPSFKYLCKICAQLYPHVGSHDALSIAIYHALRNLGLPCGLPLEKQYLALSADTAALQFDQAFRQTKISRTHFCPLDCADSLPPLKFGTATIRTFSASEFEAAINLPRLQRNHPFWKIDSQRLASFTWLVIEEDVPLDCEPGQRAAPIFYQYFDEDLGAIEPHPKRFPQAVETVLFSMLLAPWEDWVEYPNFDWRPFRIPWTFTVSDDVFAHHSKPPSSDTLSWEDSIYTDEYGDEVVLDRPIYFQLTDGAVDAPLWLNDENWKNVLVAKQAEIFGGPVMHFLVRGFLSNGIDEFLAHIMTIEAGLGSEIDHNSKNRPRIKGSNQGSTIRVATRLSALLGNKSYGDDFQHLFKVRSKYVHGRTMTSIASADRVSARSLARKAAAKLIVTAASQPTLTRDAFLQNLLIEGEQFP